MSDPVTNVEIEDVLSSIRRLVSDGDKARTRDIAAAEPVPEAANTAAPDADQQAESAVSESKVEKLVLTPAFLVVDSDHRTDAQTAPQAEPDDAQEQAEDQASDEDHDDENSDHSDSHDQKENDDAEIHDEIAAVDMDDVDDAPLSLTEMVWEDVDSPKNSETDDHAIETPDRSELVATIAELEAAISTDAEEYEPDGSEVMAETIAWPGAVARQFADAEEAEPAEESEPAEEEPEVAHDDHHEPDDGHIDDHVADPQEPEDSETASADTTDRPETVTANDDVYVDDDLDDLLEAGGVTLDEDALRAMVADVVREELTGPLGERITRNVRKLVRREIYRILSSQDFD